MGTRGRIAGAFAGTLALASACGSHPDLGSDPRWGEGFSGKGALFDMTFEGGGDPTFHSRLEDVPRKLVLDDGQTQYTFAPAQ